MFSPDVVRSFNQSRDLSDKAFEALCYAPFVHLSFTPDGNAAACCSSRSLVLGNVRRDRLADIWKGPKIRRFREALRKDVLPAGCATCTQALESRNFETIPIRQFDEGPVAAVQGYPTRLEFAFSNLCNLGCIMCSPELSSVIRTRHGLPPLADPYDDAFFEDLEEFLPHAREVCFMGGEPFLHKQCHRVWDSMIRMGLKIPVVVVTNGTVWNDKVEHYLGALPFDVTISIDGVQRETIERIRRNARYDGFRGNLERFRAYAKRAGRGLHFNFCLMQQNWREAADVFTLADSMSAGVRPIIVFNPDDCSIYALPLEEKKQVLQGLEARTPEVDRTSAPVRAAWHAMVDELRYHVEQGTELATEILGQRRESIAETTEDQRSPMYRAWELMSQGKHDEALAQARTTEREDPFFFKAKLLAGEVLVYREAFAAAEAEFETAREVVRDHPEVWMRLAWLRQMQGRAKPGLDFLRRAEAAVERLEAVEAYVLCCIADTKARLLQMAGDVTSARETMQGHLAAHPGCEHVAALEAEAG